MNAPEETGDGAGDGATFAMMRRDAGTIVAALVSLGWERVNTEQGIDEDASGRETPFLRVTGTKRAGSVRGESITFEDDGRAFAIMHRLPGERFAALCVYGRPEALAWVRAGLKNPT